MYILYTDVENAALQSFLIEEKQAIQDSETGLSQNRYQQHYGDVNNL